MTNQQDVCVAVVTDPNGTEWSVHRRWWPFPDVFDIVDVAFFGWIGLLFALPFLLLWPIWLATKFLGARWTIEVERNGSRVDTELVRGWARSDARIAELSGQLAQGWRSGNYAI